MCLTFEDLNLERFGQERSVALALSGGPDSMALAWILSCWSWERAGPEIHALTIDHGLRCESAEEAQQVKDRVKDWPKITPHILTRKVDSSATQSRIMERARRDRYKLLREYCREKDISCLFIAHHREDQAETFLIRLAAGSGLDGLSGMKEVQPYEDDLMLVRPLLNACKEDLVAVCCKNNIPYVEDPSNLSSAYLRPRLRAAREVLEAEGLTSKRLARSAQRLGRARRALEEIAEETFEKALKDKNENRLVFDLPALQRQPEEIFLRVVSKAIAHLGCGQEYGPRMEKLEALFDKMKEQCHFKPCTLGGVRFAIKDKNTSLWIEREHQ